MLPFTREQFVAVFVDYNTAIWPAQVLAYALGAAAVGLIFRPGASSDKIVAAILAVMWLWTGIAYHWLAFSAINGVAPAFGFLFAVQALMILFFGVARGRLGFAFDPGLRGVVGLAFVAYAMVLYPLIGFASGHAYPPCRSSA